MLAYAHIIGGIKARLLCYPESGFTLNMIRKENTMFTINEKKQSLNAGKEIKDLAIQIASDYKDLSKETQYLLTAYLTLLCDIKQVRVDNDPQASLARQVQYVAENRFKSNYGKVSEILESFATYFNIKEFEKAQSKPTPKAEFIAFLNSHKNVQLATALAKGKEYGLTDIETLESINLWTAGQAVSA